MRYSPILTDLFVQNRKQFTGGMQANTIALFASNDVKHTNADGVMGFVQNSDLFYLSGIDQEETLLMLYPEHHMQGFKEILFIRETDENTRLYDGERLTKEEARKISGVERVCWTHEFEDILQLVAFEADGFYLGHNEYMKRLTKEQLTRQDRLIAWVKEKYPLHDYHRAAKITRELRPIKSPVEVSLIQKAIGISAAGYMRVIKALRPGVKEYELEAELTYEIVRNGSRHAFEPIFASGKNACVLHYVNNAEVCQDGDMILMDFGVSYANYSSDTTRCLPVNGKFSPRQREVYSSVLHCLKEGSKLLRPGVMMEDYNRQMGKLVEEQLIKLGLLKQEEVDQQDPAKPLYLEYFMHGTAHHIGLDVHDVGLYKRPIREGMVMTCEPGIYIREEGIGCRLENDYLIGKSGNVNLTRSLPIEIEEIEEMMAGRGEAKEVAGV